MHADVSGMYYTEFTSHSEDTTAVAVIDASLSEHASLQLLPR